MTDAFNFKVLDKLTLSPIVTKIRLISFFIFIILIFMLFLPWQQSVKGKGTVVAFDPTQRDYSILATIDGYIDNFYVHENQFVKKGTLLFSMVDLDNEYNLRLQESLTDTKKQYKNTQNEIINLKKNMQNMRENLDIGLKVYAQKKRQIDEKIKSLHFKKLSLEINYKSKKRNFKRMDSLYKDGIESKRAYDKAENSLTQAEANLKKNSVDIEIERRNIEILKKEQDKFSNEINNKIKNVQNNILKANSHLKSLSKELNANSTKIQRYKNRKVVAQKDGYVVRIFTNDKNKFIKKGEKILYFSPIVSQKSLLLKVSDFSMPLIKEGLPVRIMFYGWPALQISGWPKIQYGSFGGRVAKVERVSHEKGFYYAYVLESKNEPWPTGDKLRIGTQATAWVRLSTVPIWYQVWRLMNALPPKMVHPDREKYE